MATKTRKQRGSRTYGHGAGKKNRGAGSRGGRGFAGAGKRGAQKKTWYHSKGIQPLGKKGMIPRKDKKTESTINLSDITFRLDKWLAAKKIKTSRNAFEIDLSELGFDKLLGTGELSKKLLIKVANFSKKAKEKVEKAGGKIESSKKSSTVKEQINSAKGELSKRAKTLSAERPTAGEVSKGVRPGKFLSGGGS